ncbi:MAG: DUF1569 domain-containing protein [Gemmatimonadaceae bacterium]|nr:DUF1569 domain-containing protein [Gemmatimonadaceae bacterium]
MKTLFQVSTREEVMQRFRHLTRQHQARWGRMNAPRMVRHITESVRMAVGDLHCRSKNSPLSWTPIKQIIIYWLPFPRGAPTALELMQGDPGECEADLANLSQLVNRLAERESATEWAAHPAFGPLTGRQWGVLSYRHADHHLRQFGV